MSRNQYLPILLKREKQNGIKECAVSDRSQAVRQLSNLIASERDDRRRPHLLSRLYSALKSEQDADPHIPILKQAKAEYAKLQ